MCQMAAAVAHPCESALPQIEVTDTRLALGSLTAHWRQQFSLPVVAITGSNGKTTVRAMTAAVLSHCGDTLATQGNLNKEEDELLNTILYEMQVKFVEVSNGSSA